MKYHKYMIKMKRKGLSAKGITIIALVLIIALGIATAVVTIFALSGHTMLSSVKISYTATDIDGSASVTYQLLSEDGTNDGEVVSLGSIEFKANNTTNPTQNLSPAKTLELSTTQPYVEFTYTFNNTGSLDYIATLTFVDVIQDENIGFDYKYKEYDYGTENFAILVQGIETSYSQATYKVKMKVEDIALDANWNGVFNWELKAFEADTIEEQKSVRAMDYTENGSGTYTANYNGGTLENNTLVISGNVGGINVTSVGQIRNLPYNSKVVICEGITTIEEVAFRAQHFSEIELPDSLENIDASAFAHSSYFKSITIPASVTEIIEGAFAYCTKLEEIIVEDGSVFDIVDGCLIKENVVIAATINATIPQNENITAIGDYAFTGCRENLTELIIPNTVTRIGIYAFRNCSSVTEVIIPNSVQEIGEFAFANMLSLENVRAEEGGVFTSKNNCILKGTELYFGCKNSVIPQGVTKIMRGAFAGVGDLNNITIPNSVERIESYAFSGCTGLSSVVFDDNSVCYIIAQAAFSDCESLRSIILPRSVVHIGRNVFENCSGLEEIYVLAVSTETVIYIEVFKGCSTKFYCCLSGPGENWGANWQEGLTEIHWNYVP